MGQRLNIEIMEKEEILLANAYYHWSGYTSSSIYLTQYIIRRFDEVIKNTKKI